MSTLALELSDAAFLTAICEGDAPHLIDVPDKHGSTDWPGFCYADGPHLSFGRSAEDMWFVHPRRVAHNIWQRLTHEPASLVVGTKAPSFSELAFFFLREFWTRAQQAAPAHERLVLALPGAYLKDAATEEEKIGLLLGMAGELKLPLAGMIDLAAASLCDPRAPGFNPALPIVVVDLHLDDGDFTLFTADTALTRRDYQHLPQAGLAQLVKQLTGTMGNRFLRHTAFDILEDGRIEQTFFRQTKEFFVGEAPEFRFHINTANRVYEMLAKREQLAADAQPFVASLVASLQAFLQHSAHASDPCTIALTHRAACLPGLEARLRHAGYPRLLRLPAGAAACGAARIGATRLRVHADLAEVPVETSVPLSATRRLASAQWEARLAKLPRDGAPRPAPTHAILDGIGHALGAGRRFTIGNPDQRPDLLLPATFSAADGCSIALVHDDGKFWLPDTALGRTGGSDTAARTLVESGDRLNVRCGSHHTEVLFVHCPLPSAWARPQ